VAESTPELQCVRKDYVDKNFQWHRWESNRVLRLVAPWLSQLRNHLSHINVYADYVLTQDLNIL
jgi:hypothetical protein